MSADLGELALGTFIPMLRTLRPLLDRGAATLDPATMPGARLADDMFPLSKQVSLPHFYFHVVTAYDILRAKGVVIGKRDYLAHAGDAIRPRAA